jgi:hypothetical protein
MIDLVVWVPEDVRDRLAAEAEERGLTVADLGGLVVAAWVRSKLAIDLSEADLQRDQ